MAPTARRRVTLSTGSRLGPGPSVLTSRGDLPDFRGPRHVPTLPPRLAPPLPAPEGANCEVGAQRGGRGAHGGEEPECAARRTDGGCGGGPGRAARRTGAAR